jgi:monoamine oxidase
VRESVDVVVVGAGFAGLVAARELGAQGIDVLVLEARERVGGRTYYRTFRGMSESVELGGTWFDPNLHTALRDEAARYGIPIARGTQYEQVRWFTGGKLRSGLPVERLEAGELERLVVEAHIAGRMLASAEPETQREYDHLSVAEWLDRFDLSPATRDFVYAFSCFVTGADPARVPALGSLVGNARLGYYYHWHAEWNHLIPTGTRSVAEAIAGDLRGELRLDTPVRAIRQDESGVTVVHDGGTAWAGHVVLAVPVNAMSGIAFDPPLARERMRFLEQGHLCRMTKIWMLATGVPERMLGAGWNTPFYWVSTERQVDDAQLVLAWSLERAIDAEDVSAVEQALRVYAPGARVLAVDYHDWVEDQFARGGWMVPPAGWETSGARTLLAQHHGRVLMAGSDVSPEHSGSIEGAIRSGRRVARELVESAGSA